MDDPLPPSRPDPGAHDAPIPSWQDLLAVAGDMEVPEPLLDLMRPSEDRRP
ncbi:hypothetical protein SAMN04488020_102193 [Palleronia marisminoris]|uniref:Uncharacterized protein n=1 Tax=Palleronia marisminoris TaxID=315423 RepID=A0A1Y5RY01_9RHOB|nr:hypothetical protein [Palleronia marisminoris]SFG42437.1 hypothetical protein SAMN04488020_102193 [Palleronia marisminoris]SLN27591.1 hypothetical protein PAM7066_01088 [Palleronia marisminoris]